MGLTASLTAMSNVAFEAFGILDDDYRPKGEVPRTLTCDLDKAWHIVHFMLTGASNQSSAALGILLDRGPQMEAVSETCQAISPAEMQAFQAALAYENPVTLWARFDFERMVADEVYRVHPDDDPEGSFAYALHFIPLLRRFAAKCAEHRCGAILMIA
jgi:hypothetical protein